MSATPRKFSEPPPEVGPEVPGSRHLTMPEVAELLGISERAARDWVKRHDLPTTEGRPVRISEAQALGQMASEGRGPRKSPEATSEAPGSGPEVPGSSEPIEVSYTGAAPAEVERAI